MNRTLSGRLSVPNLATQQCHRNDNWDAIAWSNPVLSYLGSDLLKYPAPTKDKEQTVSRRQNIKSGNPAHVFLIPKTHRGIDVLKEL